MKLSTTRPQTTFFVLFMFLFLGVISPLQSYGQTVHSISPVSLERAFETGLSLESLLIHQQEFKVKKATNFMAQPIGINQKLLRNEAEDTRKKRLLWMIGGAAAMAATTTAILLSSGGGSQGTYIPDPPGRP